MPKPRKKLSKRLGASQLELLPRGDVLKWKRMGPKQAGSGGLGEGSMGVGQERVAMNLNKKRRDSLRWGLDLK